MRAHLAAVWQCRHFWLALVGIDLRTRYRRSFLGVGWSLLQPICMTIILCTAFHQLFHADPREYGLYVLAGLAFWNYVLAVTVHSCLCFLYGEGYLRQVPTPLAIYPLRSTLGGAIHFFIALAVVVLTSWVFNGVGNLPALVALVPAVLLLLVFGWSTALLMGFATTFFQDTQHIAEVLFQVLFYATPVLFKPGSGGPYLNWVFRVNPLSPFLRLVREPILEGRVPPASTYILAAFITAVAFTSAVVTLARLQKRLIFRL
jgi:ABC-type polysaccharide/polyol phosphate export permease